MMPVKDVGLTAHWRTPQSVPTIETLEALANALDEAELKVLNFTATASGYSLTAEDRSKTKLPLPKGVEPEEIEPAIGCQIGFMKGNPRDESTIRLSNGYLVSVAMKHRKEPEVFNEAVTMAKRFLRPESATPVPEHTEVELTEVLERHRDETDRLVTATDEATTKLQQLYDRATARQEELEKLYREKMRLSAPAGYWDTKAKESKAAARNWLGLFIVALAALGGLFFMKFSELTGRLQDAREVPIWILIAMAFAFGVGIWILRLIIKNALSSLHLYHDAMHRKVMTDAFLALRKDAELAPAHESAILAVLFRPPTIGLADEGPSLTMVENLLKNFKGKL
jgi:hypothetical protein